MSNKKKKIVLRLEKLSPTSVKHGYALNQHSDTMRDHTKYRRNTKHRPDYRNSDDGRFFY